MPRELVEGDPVGEGTLLTARRDEDGNVVLRRLRQLPTRRYTEEELSRFAEEDAMPRGTEQRLRGVLKREPRFFGRQRPI